MSIHPTAIVDPGAHLAEDVEVGPYTLIGAGVEIESGTKVNSHVVIKGPTRIGKDNHIFQFASVGEDCQDLKYAGEPTELVIGDRNTIRENVTIHRGTVQDKSITRIGNDNLLMAYCHVAHDCVVGNHIVLANAATLAGHVQVDDHAILGGGTMVHQFCKIGAHSMCAGGSIVLRDVPAYVMASGQSASAHGLNSEGLRRRGFDSEVMRSLKRAYKTVFRQGLTLSEAIAELESQTPFPELDNFIETLKRTERGIIR